MTNHHTKLEDPWAMRFLVIDRTSFVDGPMDERNDRPTCAKQYTPSSSKGVIIMKRCKFSQTLEFDIKKLQNYVLENKGNSIFIIKNVTYT